MGAETMLFAVCGTTDVVLNSITFATVGVEDFMSTTMGVNVISTKLR